MLEMRRLIKREFSIIIHLDEADAARQLLRFANGSSNDMLRDMATELELLIGSKGSRVEARHASTSEGLFYALAQAVAERKRVRFVGFNGMELHIDGPNKLVYTTLDPVGVDKMAEPGAGSRAGR